MKIAALALANLALALADAANIGTIHGGVGDHSLTGGIDEFVIGQLTATIDPNNEEDITITQDVTTDGMEFPAETVMIKPNFVSYTQSADTLATYLGTDTTSGNQTVFEAIKVTLGETTYESTVGPINSGPIDVETTLLTTTGSAKITEIKCEDFLHDFALKVTLDNTLTTVLTVSSGVPTATYEDTITGYTYTLTDGSDTTSKCGFTYSVERFKYTVNVLECTDMTDGESCEGDTTGYQTITPFTMDNATVSFTIDGYTPDELTLMSTANITHTASVVSPNFDASETGSATIGGTLDMDASCGGQLDIQTDCKYDELCFFRFHVGPCTVVGFDGGDEDILVEPYSVKSTGTTSEQKLFPNDSTFPKYILPKTASQLVSTSEFMQLSKNLDDKDNTAMQLLFDPTRSVDGDGLLDLTSDFDYTGVTLHGPAQYRADNSGALSVNNSHSYEIIGYIKFAEEMLNYTSTQLSNVEIVASSYVRLVIDPNANA